MKLSTPASPYKASQVESNSLSRLTVLRMTSLFSSIFISPSKMWNHIGKLLAALSILASITQGNQKGTYFLRMCNTNKAVAALSEFPASIAGRCESGGEMAPPLFLHLVRKNEANPDCAIYILHNGQKSGKNRLR